MVDHKRCLFSLINNRARDQDQVKKMENDHEQFSLVMTISSR